MTDNLIARLEAAEGPSRELDGEIWCAANGLEFHSWDGAGVVWLERRHNPSNGAIRHYPTERVRNFTASLDAAVSLINAEGWGWEIDAFDPDKPCAIIEQSGICEADTPALALLIAFFRVKIANS